MTSAYCAKLTFSLKTTLHQANGRDHFAGSSSSEHQSAIEEASVLWALKQPITTASTLVN